MSLATHIVRVDTIDIERRRHDTVVYVQEFLTSVQGGKVSLHIHTWILQCVKKKDLQ